MKIGQEIEFKTDFKIETVLSGKVLQVKQGDKAHALNELAWIHTDKEAYEYALRLYSSRIWENTKWVGYEAFNIELNKISEVEQISLF